MTNLIHVFVNLPPLLSILLKITLVLSVGWILHFSLLRCNPRWRVLLWRGVILAVIMVPILLPLTYFQISIAPPREPAPESVVIPQTRVTSGYYMTEMPDDLLMESIPIAASVTENISHPSFSLTAWAREHLRVIVLFGWGFMAFLLATRVAAAFMRIRKKIAASSPAPDHLQGLLRRVAHDFKCSRKVWLRYSSDLTSPFLTGLRRSVLILPERMIDPKYANELPAIFAHELAHLRSRDLLWMHVTRWLSILMWFHPLVWRIPNAHNASCEEVCDAVAADYIGNASSYSSTLARVALKMIGNAPAVGGIPMARSSEIIGRLRILKRKIYSSPLARHWVALSLVLGTIVLAGLGGLKLVYAQENPSPAVDIVELKDGSTIEGTTQQSGEILKIQTVKGVTVSISMDRVASIEKKATPDPTPMPSPTPSQSLATEHISDTSSSRVVHFPKSRSLGQLSIQTRPITRTYYLGPNRESISEWEYFGEAMGDVTVPGGRRLQLLVSEACSRDLSPLSKLRPDDLYMLGLHSPQGVTINADDKIMPHIRGLTGLKDWALTNVNITHKGVQFLKDFKSLKNVRILCPTQDSTDDISSQIGDQEFAQLAEIKSLETLFLVSKNITDEGLRHLAKLPSLKEMYIYSPKIKGPGLAHLANMPSLRYLNLRGNRLGDTPLQYLKNSKTLKSLELGDNEITDAGLAHLSNLTQLEELNLLRAKITNNGLVHLKPMRSLKKLDLAHTQIDDDGVFHLKEMKSLEDLDINTRGKPLTDKGLAYVSELSNLKRLTAGGSSNGPFTDEGLKHLSRLKFLEELLICGKGITDEGMSHIAKLPNLKKLTLLADSVTNEGLAKLTSLKSLENLMLNSKKVTLSGLRQLNALPNLTSLSVSGVVQDNTGLDISGLTTLETLTISLAMTRKEGSLVRDQFRDEDLACLAKLPRLKWLQGIRGVSDAGIAHLAGLTSLQRLSIAGPSVTDEGLPYLANMKQLRTLRITGDFTDAGLRHLEGLKALSFLRIYSANNFNQEALERLQDKLPNLASFQADVDREIREIKKRTEIGTVAPPFTVKTLDAKEIKLESYRGKVVLLYFWATWCKPCVASAPALKEFYEDLRGHDDFMMIGLSLDEDETILREFIKQHALTLPQVRLGQHSKVASDYGVSGVPTYILVGPDRKILLSRERNLNKIKTEVVKALGKNS